ncbi:MAG: DinB family protein, partial [Acidobacteriota bacterium]
GYMATLVADIPRWIQYIIEKSVIDFATYEQFKGKTADELVAHFDKSVEAAKKALAGITDDGLKELFYLRHGEKELLNSPKHESISQAINHLVHHRGQLTVYLRMNDLKIPSIYGPSGDSGGF